MRSLAFAAVCAFCAAALPLAAKSQSMWPMQDGGVTFADRKGQMVTVGNPYARSETFELKAYQADYTTPVDGVVIAPASLTLGAGATRRVKIIFDLPDQERTIAVCVNPSPKAGQMVVPRVCGRYSGRRAGVR